MGKVKIQKILLLWCLTFLLSGSANTLTAATIWSGPRRTFTKANFTDYTQATNQDRLTPKVWLTRDDSFGPFNFISESGYASKSPADTEWAYGTTSNLPSVFNTWVIWHGTNAASSVGKNAVVHLISENIYIDIKFTTFTSGGGFTYERAGYVHLAMNGAQKTVVSRSAAFTDPGAVASNSAGVALIVSVDGTVAIPMS